MKTRLDRSKSLLKWLTGAFNQAYFLTPSHQGVDYAAKLERLIMDLDADMEEETRKGLPKCERCNAVVTEEHTSMQLCDTCLKQGTGVSP